MKNREKNAFIGRHTATITMFLMFSLALLPSISAWDWDNNLDYENDDMTVVFENAFGLPLIGEVLGKAELKSHTSVTEVKNIIAGRNRVPMYYDFYEWKEIYGDGLGEVEFTNMKTGEKINKKYKFVYAVYEDYDEPIYETSCTEEIINYPAPNESSTTEEICVTKIVDYKTSKRFVEWKELIDKDIPKGATRIGIMVDVQTKEHIDAVWTIAGKEISKHAEWTEALSVDLVSYWTLDEPAGEMGDEKYVNNGTPIGTVYNQAGKIGTSYHWDNDADKVLLDSAFTMTGAGSSISMWFKLDSTTWEPILGKNASGSSGYVGLDIDSVDVQTETPVTKTFTVVTPSTGVWYHLVITRGSDTTKVYINGTESVSGGQAQTGDCVFDIFGSYRDGTGATEYNGYIDEVGLWERELSSAEVTQLWNGSLGLTYVLIDSVIPEVNITYPQNTTYTNLITRINVTYVEENPDVCWYSNDSGVTNSSGQSCDTNFTDLTYGQGSYTINVYMNDTSGNENYSNLTFYVDSLGPAIIIDSPANNSFHTINDVEVSRVATDPDLGTCWRSITGATTSSNTTRSCNADDTSITYSEGVSTYWFYANDTLGNENHTSVTFTVDTIPPEINITYPQNTTYNELITRINVTYTEANPSYCWYSNDSGVTNSTGQVCGNNWTSLTYGQGSYTITAYINDTASRLNRSSLTFFVDSLAPDINITTPANYTNSSDTGLDVNYTYAETNIGSCWWTEDRGVTNTTITCGNNLTSETWKEGNNTIIIYINDTAGNTNSTSVFFTRKLFIENFQTFANTTIEGTMETFVINFTYDESSFPNIAANLLYNNTNYSGTFSGENGEGEFTVIIEIPPVDATSTVGFNWSIDFINNTHNFRTSISYNQSVSGLAIDDCSVHGVPLLNMSLKDEGTKNVINGATYNTSIEIDLQIYPLGSSEAIINYSQNYSENNNPKVCLENSLNDSSYTMDVQIEYDGEGYAHEFYHIQNFSLINSTLHQNITLYDLLDADSQEFVVTYKDENFLAVANALIQIQRKYISEGLFRTVEIPRTDSEGSTLAHLVVEDVIYTFIIVKNGEVLATFDSVTVTCQNPTLRECVINLNSFSSSISPSDFTELDDFTFTMDYEDSTRTIETIFTIPSGVSAEVKLNTTLYDNLGNTQACSDTLTSSSGTLTCIVPTALGNGTVISKLTKDGDLQAQAIISLEQEPSDIYGGNIVFLGLFLMLTLIGVGVQDNPMVTGFFLLLGAILAIALNLVDATGYIGAGATVLWLFIAIIIILIKGSKRQ